MSGANPDPRLVLNLGHEVNRMSVILGAIGAIAAIATPIIRVAIDNQ